MDVLFLKFQQILFSQVTLEADESVAAALLKTFRNVIIPSCELFKDYGLCTPVMKNDFVYGLKMIGQFFTSEFAMPFKNFLKILLKKKNYSLQTWNPFSSKSLNSRLIMIYSKDICWCHFKLKRPHSSVSWC